MRACGDERTARSLDLVGRHPRHGGAGAGLGGGAQFGDHGQALPPPSLPARLARPGPERMVWPARRRRRPGAALAGGGLGLWAAQRRCRVMAEKAGRRAGDSDPGPEIGQSIFRPVGGARPRPHPRRQRDHHHRQLEWY